MATEKVWDAFERIKTYYQQYDKKTSADRLLDVISKGDADYKAMLQEEFSALTKLGNRFRIRHHETDMFSDGHETKVKDNPLNENFAKKEFQALWREINHKYAYTVDFDSAELIRNAIAHIDEKLFVSELQYTTTIGRQKAEMNEYEIERGASFTGEKTRTQTLKHAETSQIKYDLIGKIAEGTVLTRRTVSAILQGIRVDKLYMFKNNPEEFITKVIRLINEQKATMIVEYISYDTIEGEYDSSIFTAEKATQSFDKAFLAKKAIQDYVFTDGSADKSIERKFAEDLDAADEVCVYAKLPRTFQIPTPVGNYSPDWAIAFYEGKVKHMFSHALQIEENAPNMIDTREVILLNIKSLLKKHNVKSIFAYNASFDYKLLPELLQYDWYDIMKLAAYKQYNSKITGTMDCYFTGKLKRNAGVESIMKLLTGDCSYHEKHNAVYDAMDELKIMKHLGRKFEDYSKATYRPKTVSKQSASSINSNRYKKTATVENSSNILYHVGDKVEHAAFGTGIILSIQPTGNDNLLEIEFSRVGTKKLFAKFARLERQATAESNPTLHKNITPQLVDEQISCPIPEKSIDTHKKKSLFEQISKKVFKSKF